MARRLRGARAVSEPLPARDVAFEGGALRVLLVEDSPEDEELLGRRLRKWAPALRLARVETADAMSRALESDVWDVILADFSLPSFGAVEALEILKSLGKDIPFIVVSGTVPLAHAMALMHHGARDFIEKHELSRLEPAIARELREAENRRLRRLAERQREELVAELRVALEKAARLNASLEEATRAKDDFLAVVSHELRTPLTAIYGWVRILNTAPLTPAKAANATRIIERNARTMTALVEDLLDVSRMVRGHMKLDFSAVDLTKLLEDVLDSLRVAVESKSLRIEQRVDPYARRVVGDEIRLRQILWNLLSNAVKFTPEGGSVRVFLERRRRSVAIRVVDTGEGIDPEFLPHVFDAFRQAGASTTTRSRGGLGLGLAIAKHLVELHGGRIEATSEGRGRGAAFLVDLPIAALWASEPVATPSGPASLSGVRVLVVDDEPDSRELLGVVLEGAGASVRLAGSFDQAVQALDEQPPDILVTDLGMPEVDGYELLRRARERVPGPLPAAAVTAHASTEDRRRAEEAGFERYLAKPVEPNELVTTVAGLAHR